MKALALLAALVAISSAAGAAEKPITLTCSGTWKSDGPLLGKRDGSVNGMRIAIDLNTPSCRVFDWPGPAGDPKVRPETIEQVITLLQRPLPDANAIAEVFARLESYEEPGDIPAPETQAEYDLFDALTVMFLEPLKWGRAREAVRRALGNGTFEVLTAFLAFVRTAHYWTETHPELAIEPDMLSVLEKHDELGRLLLDPSEAERVKAGEALRQTRASWRM